MNTASTTPRFRTDLVTQPIDADGQRFVDVTDPDSGTTFRFYEVEYAIACAMDGRRDVGGLAAWALEELGLETTTNELETVISTLGELGYLESPAVAGADRELGMPGGAPPAPTGAHIESGDFELGSPGKSPIARERPAPAPAEAIDLGRPGASDAAAAASAAEGGDERSFEGLLDDEPPTKVRQAPSRPLQTADDAQTAVRRDAAPSQPSSDFLDGITPPPAEVPSPKLRPVTVEPAGDDDGPTNLPPPAPGLEDEPEVSVDLSEHLSIDAGDVKEAVRQSQVMQAVDVPEDLLAEIEQEKKKGPPPAATEPVELPDEPARVTSAKPKAPVEPPDEEAPAPVPQKSGVSGVLLFLLFVALAGGGAYWYFMIYKKGQDKEVTTSSMPSGPAAGQPVPPPQPPPPKEITAILTEKEAEAAVVTMPSTDRVAIEVEDGAEVEAGTVVATLKGAARIQAKIKSISDRRDQYQGWLDRDLGKIEGAEGAVKDKLQKNIDKFKGKVESKTEQIERLKVDLEKLQLKAPAAGVVKVVGESGYVKEGEPLVEIGGESLLAATFDLPADKPLEVGSTATVTPKGGTGATATCEVVAVDSGKATVLCPAGEPLAAGATVILE
jgi:hypothetical protein